MEYNEEFIKKITQVGTLGYPLQKIINALEVEDEEKFRADFYDSNSLIAKSYQKGIDMGDLVIDSKLFEMAKNGDLKAMEKYEKERQLKFLNLKIKKEGTNQVIQTNPQKSFFELIH